MDLVFVNVAGAAVVVFIVWFFLLPRRVEEASASAGAAGQDVDVVVKGGYSPEIVRARPGIPLRIHFRREETSACSEEVVFPDFGVRRHLPAFETTTVELPASPAGSYRFACGMDMMHGRVVVGDAVTPASEPPPTRDAWPVDPICGMTVDPERAAATATRDGRTFFFCSAGCKERFERGETPGPMAQKVTLGIRRKP